MRRLIIVLLCLISAPASASTFTSDSTGNATGASFAVTGSTAPAIGLFAPAANTVGLSARTLPILEGTNPVSAVNYFSLTGGATGTGPTFAASGSDTNVDLLMTTKGSGQAKVNSLPVINKIVRQVFTASGTYTPTSGMVYCDVQIAGGGGAGGSVPATSGTQNSVSGAGGAGGYARKLFTAATIGSSQTVTVGAGGAPGAAGANAGGNGGNTTFGSLLTANGGHGGASGAATTNQVYSASGSGGTASGGDINITGSSGTPGWVWFIGIIQSGIGGGNPLSPNTGVATGGAGNVIAGLGYGGGGSGNWLLASAAAAQGAAGAAGIVIVTEYVSQ